MAPGSVVGMICVILNIPFNYIFIFGVGNLAGMGLKGAAIATSISRFVEKIRKLLFQNRGLLPILLWGWVLVKGLHKNSSPKIYREAIYKANVWKYIRFSGKKPLRFLKKILSPRLTPLSSSSDGNGCF